MRKAVAYMRYSSLNQDANSISYQRMHIVEYCKRNDIEIVKEYIDEAISGTTDEREAFEEMMSDVHGPRDWDMVVIYDLSRFSRDMEHSVVYSKELEQCGVELESVTQNFGKTNEGILARNIVFAFNDFFIKNLAKTTHAGMKSTAKTGSHCGGTPPLGYDLDANKQLVINEKEAEIVKAIFDLYESGCSYTKMAKILNGKGYTSKTGRPFAKNSFYEILKREKYIGTFTWNKTAAKDANGKRTSRKQKSIEEQVREENGCPAIITKEQFERVQSIMSGANGKRRKAPTNHYMLSGLKFLKCKECGSLLIGTKTYSHGIATIEYYCPRHKIEKTCSTKNVNAVDLDRVVGALLTVEIFQRSDLDSIIKAAKNNDKVQKLKDRIKGKECAIAHMMKAIEENYNSLFAKRVEQLAKEKEELEARLIDENEELKNISIENKKAIKKKIYRYLKFSGDALVKKYLMNNVESIIVSNDDIEINYF